MTDLHACYFCGDVGEHDAVDVVPSEVTPTPDEQVTVRLCETCHSKLTHLIDPLVSRARAAGTATDPTEATAIPEGTTRETEAETETETAIETAVETETETAMEGDEITGLLEERETSLTDDPDEGVALDAGDGTADESDPATQIEDGTERGAHAESVEEARGPAVEDQPGSTDTEARMRDAEDADDARDAYSQRSGEPARNGRREVTLNPATEDESGEVADDPDTSDTEGVDGGTEAEPGTDDDGSVDETGETEDGDGRGEESDSPDGGTHSDVRVDRATFRKVMRLLANRDFPVVRTEVEDLASSAYDLDEPTVEAIVDAAIERGFLRAEGTDLYRP